MTRDEALEMARDWLIHRSGYDTLTASQLATLTGLLVQIAAAAEARGREAEIARTCELLDQIELDTPNAGVGYVRRRIRARGERGT